MKALVSAKGKVLTAWRAAEEFSAAYRQAVLDRAASDLAGSGERVYSESIAILAAAAETHQTLLKEMNVLLQEGATLPSPVRMKELTARYYELLYRHQEVFHSAPAFYQKSMEFLKMLSAAIMARATDQLGLFARHLPQMALIALGPAGRGEFSPFCRLEMLLVHEEVPPAQRQTINLFCHTLHEEFEAAGLAVDQNITPRNPQWRGSLADWRERCHEGLQRGAKNVLIDILRLTDLYPLFPAEGIEQAFRDQTLAALRSNRPAQANLVTRMESLSHGIGLMGGLKLERSGAGRGMFSLINHGLLPLSAALSALALLKGSNALSSYDRIIDLLDRRELDVDQAEKTLEVWYYLHELLLRNERGFSIVEHAERSLFLDSESLTGEERQTLKAALTSVAMIQRHVGIVFSGMGE